MPVVYNTRTNDLAMSQLRFSRASRAHLFMVVRARPNEISNIREATYLAVTAVGFSAETDARASL